MRSDLLELLRAEPGGEAVLQSAQDGVHLVGGSVRDLLLGRRPRELDLVVEGDIGPTLRALGGEQTVHDRFGTASVRIGSARIDVARARRESYPRPGALPEVSPAPLGEDLLRRDFTVNALALALAGPDRGAVREVPGALEDLEHRRLRVLHRQSFLDDPTRLWRLCRYSTRLGFQAEDGTAALARAAVADGAIETLSAARLGAELRLALTEDRALATLEALATLGALRTLGVQEAPPAEIVRVASGLLPTDGREDLLLLTALLRETSGPVGALLDGLEFTAPERDRVLASLRALPALTAALPADPRPSELHALACATPPEAVALAAALAEGTAGGDGAARRAAERWLMELRHVRLRIDGHDLIAAGIAQGPDIGRRLEATLRRRLDGELADGAEAELRAALEGLR